MLACTDIYIAHRACVLQYMWKFMLFAPCGFQTLANGTYLTPKVVGSIWVWVGVVS